MDEARVWRARLISHPLYALIKTAKSRKSYYVVTVDAHTNIQDSLPVSGITETLADQFWPDYTYKAAATRVAAVPTPLRRTTPTTPKTNPLAVRVTRGRGTSMVRGPSPLVKRTYRAIRLAAADRGTTVHEQVAHFISLMVLDVATAQSHFDSWLFARQEAVHPATIAIIKSFNEVEEGVALTYGRLERFAPIWSEVVVCDMPGVRSGTPKPWGTAVDALVYDTVTGCVTVVEIKTSAAAFEEGAHQMRAPLEHLRDSPLNQARVQLTVTKELARRTYPDLFGNTALAGLIVMATPDGKRTKRYFLDAEMERRILERLHSIEWIERGKQEVLV